jgi:alkyl hydroperoxide reductase subunit AhpC
MTLQLGDIAPDFEQDSTVGRFRLYDYLGSGWGILFSHPKDFTPVCTTELGEAARLKPEFDKRGVKIVGLSVDPAASHDRWAADIEGVRGHKLNFPLVADADRKVATLYGMIHPNADPALTVRAVYVSAPDRKIRLTLTYPPSTGRNFAEILRTIDSLQLTDAHKVATPVNWQPGEDVIIVPSLSDADAKARFPEGWTALTPYLRVVKQPGLAR